MLRMGRSIFDGLYEGIARCSAEIGCTDDTLSPLLENSLFGRTGLERHRISEAVRQL